MPSQPQKIKSFIVTVHKTYHIYLQACRVLRRPQHPEQKVEHQEKSANARLAPRMLSSPGII
jgi:hypothetical protein